MTLIVKPGFNGMTDADAIAYVNAVEAADGQLLEFGVGAAINDFVVGCKLDNTWSAIKASCILAGARTLSGALVPLAGTAPTNFNFVSGDYNRKTGLVGDGSTKYLDSNRNNNADPQNNSHLAVYKNDSNLETNAYWVGSASLGFSSINAVGRPGIYSNSTLASNLNASNAVGLHGLSRVNSSTASVKRPALAVFNVSLASTTPATVSNFIFTINGNGTPVASNFSASRLAFYSIGESLDLALLDARVTTLINAIGAAIP